MPEYSTGVMGVNGVWYPKRSGFMYKPYNGPKNMKSETIVAPWSYARNNEVDKQILWVSF